ncbi:related to 4-cresol dehydrogenase flavoprotein subunit [Cephalotrichum gorgonifer]|uniref:Related to 4-cresol dehydrogenase flavoprotein subunit n=1 Tax=Cephalotrichum gorgonifer TaxID=2041049 RepID=A0AAE8MQ26_9PEZI|nr:related to 4-cresol dehydrogenase flavoprotein subunit [Cephalotrichum gorgonifer]
MRSELGSQGLAPFHPVMTKGASKVSWTSSESFPQSVGEIQAILKVANQRHVPLYGGPAPRLAGSVVLSLQRMNRILEVNEKLCYILVEPGVTFFDVYNYLVENKLNLWVSVPALGWGSVVGNTLDRGHGYTTTGDRQHFIGSLEVLLSSGDVLRTGQWAVPNSPSAHACSNSFGPQIDGLFLQSNLGIVTKMAVALDPAPASFMDMKIHCPEVDDIAPLVDMLQQLDREGITQNHGMITNINHFASHDAPKHAQQTVPGPLTPESIAILKEKYKTGYWRCALSLYGPKQLVLARWARIQEVIPEKLPNAWVENTLFEGEDGKPVDNRKVGTLPAGVPSMNAVKLAEYNLPADGTGAGAHIDTTLILPCEGEAVSAWFKKARAIMEEQGVDPFIGCHVFSKYILFVQEYVFDKTNAKHREGGRKVVEALLSEAEKCGFANYRSHVQHMDTVQNLYGFNDHAYRRFVESIKAALDPNGILSPGKQGIWPAKKLV